MENEPVKVKMTLRAARPSIQGATPTPSSAAAVEAVEARWRREEKKARAERFRGCATGCLSWLFILLVVAGGAWYFLGEKHLPQEYTFSKVWELVKNWWDPPPPEPAPEQVQIDPADEKTTAMRTRMKDFVSQLEELCAGNLSKQTEAISIKADAWQIGQSMLNEIVSADNWYFKSKQKLEEMENQNEKLSKLRTEESNAKRRQYAAQYRPELVNRQRNEVERKLSDCKRVRAQVVQRAIKAIKAASAQWTGPESKRDATQLLKRLDNLAKKSRDMK